MIYLVAAIIAILLWSTSFVGTKIAYHSFSPLTLGAARFLLATIILGIIVVLKREFTVPTVKDMGIIALSGLLGITLYFAMENIGVELTSASNAALIVASYPAVTVLMEYLFFRVKISWLNALGIAMAIVGVYQISYTHDASQEGHLVGNLILIATGIVWACYNFSARKVIKKYSMLTITFYQTVIGAIAFIPLAWTERESWKVPAIDSVLVLIYLSLLCSVVAFLLYNYGLQKLSSSAAVTLMNLVPIFGVIFSVLFLHEILTIKQLIGGVIVIAGVFISIRQNAKQGKKVNIMRD